MYRAYIFFFSSRRRHTRYWRDWSSDVCSSDLITSADILDALDDLDALDLAVDVVQIDDGWSRGLGEWLSPSPGVASLPDLVRSEERRVGKECRSRWSPYH